MLSGLVLTLILSAPSAAPRPGAPSAPTRALSEGEIASRVRTYLAVIDTPISDAQWKALGAGAAPQLTAVLEDSRRLPTARGRALWALGLIAPAAAEAHARRILADPAQELHLRDVAIGALGQVATPEVVARELTLVMETDASRQLRARAASVLAEKVEGGCEAVRGQLAREASPEAFRTSMRRCHLSR